MASLTILVGALESSVAATDQRVDDIMSGVLRWLGQDPDAMTNQQKLDAYVQYLRDHSIEKAKVGTEQATDTSGLIWEE